jgi:hypothetical protein
VRLKVENRWWLDIPLPFLRSGEEEDKPRRRNKNDVRFNFVDKMLF